MKSKAQDKQYSFDYTDSLGVSNTFRYSRDEYPDLMTLLFDRGVEEWGECMGRAWCGTCHVSVSPVLDEQSIYVDERNKILELYNRSDFSRLACQVYLKPDLDKTKIVYLGCD